MALEIVKGTFLCPTSVNATFDVTNASITQAPLAVLFFSTQQTADGVTTNAPSTVGMATNRGGSVQQCVVAAMSNEFEPPTSGTRASTSNTGRAARTDAVFVGLSSGSPAVDCLASFVSFLANGFRLNFSDAAGTAGQVVHYIALGGTDLTDAKVGAHTVVRTTAGTEATSGVGFAPDALITLSGTNAASPSAVEDPTSFGFAARLPSITQGAVAWFDKDASANMSCANSARSDSCVIIPGLTAAIEGWAAMSSFGADGFTLNWLDPVSTANNRTFFYLALQGGQYKIGAQAAPASTGSVDYTGIGFTPKGVLFAASNMVTDNANSTTLVDSGYGMGASDGTAGGSIANSQQDGNANSMAHRSHSTVRVIQLVKGTTTPTISVSAGLTSLASDQFTLNWITVDASNLRRWYYLAIGDNAGAGAFSLDCQPGSFALTGIAASPVSARFVNSAPGSYTLTGTAATVPVGRAVSADPGAYTVTGSPATLPAERLIPALPGSYAVAGVSAGTLADRLLNAVPGSYTLTGVNADLVYGALAGAFSLDCQSGSFGLTGTSTGLLSTRFLTATPGAYSLTGNVAGLVSGRFVSALPAAFALTGSQAGLEAGRAVSALPGAYALTGAASGLLATRIVSADPGAYALAGNATLVYTPLTAPVVPGSVSVSHALGGAVQGSAATGSDVTVEDEPGAELVLADSPA
jgi:hypothetical protein